MKNLTNLLIAAAGALAISGCAGGGGTVLVDGKPVPRQNREFSGQPYTIRYTGAHPQADSGPSNGLRGEGGGIAGQVCGVDVQYDVAHRGDHVQLVGTLDNQFGSQIRVEGKGGLRVITGAIASRGVDLRIGRDGVAGFVGRRTFQLLLQGQQLIETFRVANFNNVQITLKLNGPEVLLAMPAAAQGAVLPLMLACLIENFEEGKFNDQAEFTFGGPMGAAPSRRISLEAGGGR